MQQKNYNILKYRISELEKELAIQYGDLNKEDPSSGLEKNQFRKNKLKFVKKEYNELKANEVQDLLAEYK